MRRNALLALLALAVVAAACTGTTPGTEGDPTTTSVTTQSRGSSGSSTGGSAVGVVSGSGATPRVLPAALNIFDACDGLLEWIKTEAGERVGPYGFDTGGYFFRDDVVFEGDFAGPATTSAAAEVESFSAGDDAGSSRAFSGTNVQEIGVDEGDLVKTDGEYIYILSHQRLTVVNVDDREIVRSVDVGNFGASDMLLTDDRLYIFSNQWIDGPGLEALDWGVVRPGTPLTVISEIDITRPSRAEVVSDLRIEGSYVTSRLIDGIASVVVTSQPGGLDFVYPSNPGSEDRALEVNREVIADSSLEDWLPRYQLSRDGDQLSRDGDAVAEGLLSDCTRVHVPDVFSGFNTTSVLTIDTTRGLDSPNAATIFAETHTVYASATNLYATTARFPQVVWTEDGAVAEPAEEPATNIHMFDITDPDGATYVASGKVPGRLLNQFSLGEWEGDLRVAVTEGDVWWPTGEESSSSVIVLRPEGSELVEVGSVEGLGVTEQIFSVRFLGDTAYVVTFRQVDPLFVIDLSDPTEPTVAGELKIPGFSSYLHPIGDGLVIGVGSDASEEGFVEGAKVSLFDVSDPEDPTEIDSWVMRNAESSVGWDHRGFLWWAEQSLAGVPIQSYSGGLQGAMLFDITRNGIVEFGEITHAEPRGRDSDCEQLNKDDVPEDTELWFIVDEGVVQICGEDDLGGAAGLSCERIASEELQFWGPGMDDFIETIPEGGRVEICWDNNWVPPIQRLVVIDDEIWSISENAVQANDLRTLERLVTLGF